MNLEEAIRVAEIVMTLIDHDLLPQKVSVLTMYDEQRKTINKELSIRSIKVVKIYVNS